MADGLQDELRPQRHFLSRLSRKRPQTKGWPVRPLSQPPSPGRERGHRYGSHQPPNAHTRWPSWCPGRDPSSPRHLGLLPAWAVLTLAPHSPCVLRQTPVCGSPAVAVAPELSTVAEVGLAEGTGPEAGAGAQLGTPGLGPALGRVSFLSSRGPGRQLARVPHGSYGRSAPFSCSRPARVHAEMHTHRQLHLSAPCPVPWSH